MSELGTAADAISHARYGNNNQGSYSDDKPNKRKGLQRKQPGYFYKASTGAMKGGLIEEGVDWYFFGRKRREMVMFRSEPLPPWRSTLERHGNLAEVVDK